MLDSSERGQNKRLEQEQMQYLSRQFLEKDLHELHPHQIDALQLYQTHHDQHMDILKQMPHYHRINVLHQIREMFDHMSQKELQCQERQEKWERQIGLKPGAVELGRTEQREGKQQERNTWYLRMVREVQQLHRNEQYEPWQQPKEVQQQDPQQTAYQLQRQQMQHRQEGLRRQRDLDPDPDPDPK
jgi:hypothetical protein